MGRRCLRDSWCCRWRRRPEETDDDDDKFALGPRALLGCIAWILGFSLLTIALMAYQLVQAVKVEDVSYALLLASLIARSAVIVASVFSCGSYLWVAARRPRPRQLHYHGLVLLLMLPEILGNQAGDSVGELRLPGAWAFDILKYIPWGIRRVLFIHLVLKKIAALGPKEPGCLSAQVWGKRLNFCATLLASIGVVNNSWLNLMNLRGVNTENVLESRFGFKLHPGVTVADLIILRGCLFAAFLVLFAMQAINLVFFFACRRVIRKAERQLVLRSVQGGMMSKVRRTLRRHFLAICLSILTTFLTVSTELIDGGNLLSGEDRENALKAYGHMIDLMGDMTGVLLLSGIGLLLRREDAEAGDVSARIRRLLHSAVLSSRADVTFEGAVFRNPSNCCIASFPGKFLTEWRSLTWQCEQQILSSACVFLPKSDPQSRFGQHVECPETPGKCWCMSLYGEETPWGCAWFDAWKGNIERAVDLGLDLVVTFFPGQAGKGIVPWSSLGTSELWDGVGLGGSQKAEVAFLQRQGFRIVAEDIEATRRRLNSAKLNLLGRQPPPSEPS